MALTISQFQTPSPRHSPPQIPLTKAYTSRRKPVIFYIRSPKFTQLHPSPSNSQQIPRASQEEENTTTTNEKSIPDPSAEGQPEKSKTGEKTDLGRDIKAAMKERDGQKGETGFLDGVAEEIREIEWPYFNKVLGSRVGSDCRVSFTVNATLAELSDRVSAGRAAQITFKRSEYRVHN